MGAHSGRFGVVNNQHSIRNWQVSETSATKPYVASNTKGGRGRKRGTRDWSGSFTQYGIIPSLKPGQKFTFAGYTAPDDDTFGSNGKTYSGPAIVESIALTVNWQSADPVQSVINFAGDGALTLGTGLYSDDTEPDVATPEDIRAGYLIVGGSGSDSEDAVDLCLTQFTLNLLTNNVTSVNSCTAGQTQRKTGPFDWNASLQMEEDGRPDFDIDDDVELWLFLNDAMAWHLKWGLVKEFTNLNVDRETGAIISQTVNIEMNGFSDGEAGIVENSTEELWPSAEA